MAHTNINTNNNEIYGFIGNGYLDVETNKI